MTSNKTWTTLVIERVGRHAMIAFNVFVDIDLIMIYAFSTGMVVMNQHLLHSKL